MEYLLFELEHGKAYVFEYGGLHLHGIYHKNYKVLITACDRYAVGECINIKPLNYLKEKQNER